MQVIISGRHVSVTEQMKLHLENKVNSVVDSKVLKVSSVRAVMDVEKNRHKAEIIVNVKHHSFEADAETFDMYESIDLAAERIGVQIKKYIDKVQDHHKKISIKEVPLSAEEQAAQEEFEAEVEYGLE